MIATFEIRRPARGRPLVPGSILLVAFAATSAGFPIQRERLAFLGVSAILCGVVMVANVAFARRRWREASLVVTDEAIRSPGATIPLADVVAMTGRRLGRTRLVVVSTERRSYVVPPLGFADAADAPRFVQAVHDAIAAAPDGARQLARMADRERIARAALTRTPIMTRAMVATIVVVFALESMLGARTNSAMLLRLGANSPALVREGEWWRLVTANLLHVSFFHIYFNATALLSLGGLVERALGAPRFLVAALGGGLAGNLTSLAFGHHGIAAGASAMVFGLLGALLFVTILHRERLPPGFVVGTRQWILVLGLNTAISLMPGIDGSAHAGGFVGGVLAMIVFAGRYEMGRELRTMCAMVAGALIALYATGVGAAAIHFAAGPKAAGEDLQAVAFATPDQQPVGLNDLAWLIATQPDVTPLALVRADEATARAVGSEPENGGFLDTRAYVLERQGRADQARAVERDAAWKLAIPAVFTMLGRFLVENPAPRPDPARAGIVRAETELVAHADGQPGAVLYANVVHEGARAGLLRVVLPARAERGGGPAPAELPADATFDLLLVDPTSARPEQAGANTQITFVPSDPRTLALP